MEKPALPKGTRDFGPAVMARRNFILNTIRTVFQKFGFLPLETPAMENLATLTGKYGEEGDQLLFRILNSGDFLSEADPAALQDRNSRRLAADISKKGLRYDLTVPFARFVVMNRNEIVFPFKRFQIQPVWRADRPQRGRYQEFYQCDADVVGTDSLLCEAEIILMISEVFTGLGIKDYAIKINHRGVLAGLAAACGAQGNENALFVSIDKLDKIGGDKVKEELLGRGFSAESVSALFSLLSVEGSTAEKIAGLRRAFSSAAPGLKGLSDLETVLALVTATGASLDHVEFDTALARGLSYYTGCIFEVKINNVQIGSVSGGGRYDNLTRAFGDKTNLSGVGFSFGVDRIYDAMDELGLFPTGALLSTRVLVCHMGEEEMRYGLRVVASLRAAGIAAELFPDVSKIRKQMEYADKKGIPYTVVIGSDEMKTGLLAFKNMQTGEQKPLTLQKVVEAASV